MKELALTFHAHDSGEHSPWNPRIVADGGRQQVDRPRNPTAAPTLREVSVLEPGLEQLCVRPIRAQQVGLGRDHYLPGCVDHQQVSERPVFHESVGQEVIELRGRCRLLPAGPVGGGRRAQRARDQRVGCERIQEEAVPFHFARDELRLDLG